jgi:hypothetical protein
MKTATRDLGDTDVRKVLGSFLFSGDDVDKPVGVPSRGEKTGRTLAMLVCSSADVLLLAQPANAHDPASPAEVLSTTRRRHAAIVLVTHDEGLWTPSTLIECCCFRTVFWKIFGARSTLSRPPWPDQVVDHSLERIISGPEIIWPLLL